ncbi:MAG: UDP-N-acetylmuramoyl-L-alanyl-D-glutamate--2,6-diaminopimelate ligase [Myxococcota bacterium]
MMRLSALLASLPMHLAPSQWLRSSPSEDPVIRGIAYDSRRVAPGDLFVALRGSTSDGHDHLEQAAALGAVALLLEEAPSGGMAAERPAVIVPDTRRALAPIATRFFGEPSSECCLIGITGTNGKTSTSYLVESMLNRAGTRTGLIGTIEIRYAGHRTRAVNTTPESLDLQRTLRAMRNEGVEAVVAEVSSHGLELGRVNGCLFTVGAFTNLSQDHLDFHRDMDAYCESKLRLFREYLLPGASAVINIDDSASEKLCGAARDVGARLVRVTRDEGREAELQLVDSEVRLDGSRAAIQTPSGRLELSLPLVGDFNLENLLVACGIGVALGIAPEAIAAGVAACPQVPGRVERVTAPSADAPVVIVDYAHTPDAVDKLLRALRPLARGRLITLFGCGGDRDRTKRPLMAKAVERWSDRVVVTSDNPRSEDPLAILDDIERGLGGLQRVETDRLDQSERAYCVVADRRAAVRLAIQTARPEDTVVLAGKGHEDYQIVGHEKLPFDDREEAMRALEHRAQGDAP